jgi:hypothetical protein
MVATMVAPLVYWWVGQKVFLMACDEVVKKVYDLASFEVEGKVYSLVE